ncbi:tRNA lysidine(34) synthetase TilS [Auritidibacter ignavus]|uniref:tRNA lysidine(34) synthetase TilS n=1 Tax=Auritidibacter ignavus TaxID=678932 RepID=UPI0016A9C12B|nr:tRNA lysidine(34) synthetase TilS [Auritidibacter ignavus]NIH72574.1 tRNA(Ile)-lysidine synthase [Auritidibacter ignavus]
MNHWQTRPQLTGAFPPAGRWPEPLHRGLAQLQRLTPPQSLTLLGVSGGADSMALLVVAALCQTRADHTRRFGVISLDHQLQSGTAEVAAAVATIATRLGLEPVITRALDLPETGTGGLEATARLGRLEAFAQGAHTTGAQAVALGHTADDQAEQVLLGLVRGSGPRSLAGIAETTTYSELNHPLHVVRPFLGISRAETEQICHWAGIEPWQDPMNTDPRILRARIRHQVLPGLEQLGPTVRSGLLATAAIAAEDAAYLEAEAHRRYRMLAQIDKVTIRFDLQAVRDLPAALGHRVIGKAVTELGGTRPSRERTLAVMELARARPGSSAGPIQLAGGVAARRNRGQNPGEYDTLELFTVPSSRS